MAVVYLIGEVDNDNIFKIGVTKHNDIEKRKNELQTGSSQELYIKDYYFTETPYKLEKMLHRYFRNNNIINEWFEISNEDVKNFKTICEKHQNIINSLKDNPFYNNKKEQLII